MSAPSQSMSPETKGFVFHLIAFLAVNAVLVAINLSLDPTDIWFVWPLFGWGIGIGAHGLALFLHSHEERGGIYADHAVRGFMVHAYVYVGVNILLFILNMMTTPTKIWFIWPLLGWGIGVAVHGFLVMRGYNRRHGEAARAGAGSKAGSPPPAQEAAAPAAVKTAKPAAKAPGQRAAKTGTKAASKSAATTAAKAKATASAKRTASKSAAKSIAKPVQAKSSAAKTGAKSTAAKGSAKSGMAKSGTTKRAAARRTTKPKPA